MKKPLKILFRWMLGLALLPFLMASVKLIGVMIPSVAVGGYKTWWLYAIGGSVYILFERLIYKPMWLYILGHELTHAASGILSGSKIHSIKTGSTGGEVQLSKSNAFVALSPYIVPFYAVVLSIVFAIVRHWVKHDGILTAFQVLLGMAIAFHLSFTWEAIHSRQPDLKMLGLFLSCILIVLGNALILGCLIVGLFSHTPTWREYFLLLGKEAMVIWQVVSNVAVYLGTTLIDLIRPYFEKG